MSKYRFHVGTKSHTFNPETGWEDYDTRNFFTFKEALVFYLDNIYKDRSAIFLFTGFIAGGVTSVVLTNDPEWEFLLQFPKAKETYSV